MKVMMWNLSHRAVLWSYLRNTQLMQKFKSYWGDIHILMKSNSANEFIWNPEKLIEAEHRPEEKYAVVLLNTKVSIPPDVVQSLWQNASVRVTVDGGANRWLSFIKENCLIDVMKPPDYITGDFDSITEETINFFNDPRCKKIHTPDQNETDFTKALQFLKPIVEKYKINTVIAFHENTGRFDHIMGNINTLFKATKIFRNVQISLLSANSISWLLNPGEHSINIPKYLVEKKAWCALIPIGERIVASTSGLKWNLSNQVLEFGELVSTSNTYSSQLLKINTSGYLLWSMGVFSCEDD